jgi:hypothetical protein
MPREKVHFDGCSLAFCEAAAAAAAKGTSRMVPGIVCKVTHQIRHKPNKVSSEPWTSLAFVGRGPPPLHNASPPFIIIEQ